MSLLQKIIITLLALNLCACASDSQYNDIKSPCVSDDSNPNSPCQKRIPLGNHQYIG